MSSAAADETWSSHASLRGFFLCLSTFIQHWVVWLHTVGRSLGYSMPKTPTLPFGNKAFPVPQPHPRPWDLQHLLYSLSDSRQAKSKAGITDVCRKAFSLSSPSYVLRTWSPCPGSDNKIQVSCSCMEEDATSLGAFWLGRHWLGSPGAEHDVHPGVLMELAVPWAVCCVCREFGEAACLMSQKEIPYPVVWGRSGNVLPKGSGTTQQGGMQQNRVSPSLGCMTPSVNLRCRFILSTVYKGGGSLESQHSGKGERASQSSVEFEVICSGLIR